MNPSVVTCIGCIFLMSGNLLSGDTLFACVWAVFAVIDAVKAAGG